MQAHLPELLPNQSLLPAANALVDSAERIARLAGPLILIGALAGLLPEKHFLTLDALSFVVAAIATVLLPAARPRTTAPVGRGRDALLRGFIALRRDSLLHDCWNVAAIANGTWMVTFFLCVPLAIGRASATGFGGSGLGAFGLVNAC